MSKYSPQHPVLKHTQSKLFFQCERYHVSHPYKTKQVGLLKCYILILSVLGGMREEDKTFCTERSQKFR